MKLAGSRTFQVVDAATGKVIADRAVEAATLRENLVGLLPRSEFGMGEALWLACNGVHTFGMRFAIDVVFLDSRGRVLRIVGSVPPNRIVWPVRGGRATVELPAGTAGLAGLSADSVLIRWEG